MTLKTAIKKQEISKRSRILRIIVLLLSSCAIFHLLGFVTISRKHFDLSKTGPDTQIFLAEKPQPFDVFSSNPDSENQNSFSESKNAPENEKQKNTENVPQAPEIALKIPAKNTTAKKNKLKNNTKINNSSNSLTAPQIKFNSLATKPIRFLNKPAPPSDYQVSYNNPAVFHFIITGNPAGFGACLVHALNMFITAATYQTPFVLFIYDWSYISLLEFINNPHIHENSTGPICEDEEPYPSLTDHALNKTTVLKKGPLRDPRTKERQIVKMCLNTGKTWKQYQSALLTWSSKIGIEEAFEYKSRIIQQHFWQLTPKYENFITLIIKELGMFKSESSIFISVHIRRGDKLTSGEMLSIPILKYYQAVMDIMSAEKEKATVFVFSDDDEACIEFTNLVASFRQTSKFRIQVVNILDLYLFVQSVIESGKFSDSLTKDSLYHPESLDTEGKFYRKGYDWSDFERFPYLQRVKEIRDLVFSFNYRLFH